MLEWNRFESSKWRQFQSVFAGFCFRRIAERRDNGLRFKPVGELVGVVAAADLAGFRPQHTAATDDRKTRLLIMLSVSRSSFSLN